MVLSSPNNSPTVTIGPGDIVSKDRARQFRISTAPKMKEKYELGFREESSLGQAKKFNEHSESMST